MRISFLLAILLCVHTIQAQGDSTYFLKEVGMTIRAPRNFEVVGAEEDENHKKRGKQFLEDTQGVEVDVSGTKTLLSLKDGPYNYLNITITTFTEDLPAWHQQNRELKNILYSSFLAKMEASRMDTTSSTIDIDGIPFQRFELKLQLGEDASGSLILYSSLYRKYDFGICYFFVDPQAGRQIDDMIRRAVFTRDRH